MEVDLQFVISFTTKKFDVSKEQPNPINPIYGQSLLLWLQDKAKEVTISPPDYEDWGWYSYLEWKGRSYMIGASASEADDGSYEWVFQIDKYRSLVDKLLGREKMNSDDECLRYFKSVFDSEPEFKSVLIE
jgi:hypothetical protein